MLVSSKAVDILPQHELSGVDAGKGRKFGVEVVFVTSAMLRQKGCWSGNVEVVSEVSDVEHNRMAFLGDTKKPDNSSATVEGPFLGFNLLEAKILIVGVKASQRRPAPCLVLSRGPLFYDSVDRFEDIGFELAFGMGRMGSGPVRMLLTGGCVPRDNTAAGRGSFGLSPLR